MSRLRLTLKAWFEGKKTYLLAMLVCVAAVVLVCTHRLTPEMALGAALFALGLFAGSFRAVLERHHDETLAVLHEVQITADAVVSNNVSLAVTSGAQLVEGGVRLAEECKQEASAQ